MRISARADYAVRACLELAAAPGPLTADDLAARQRIPAKFLSNILTELKHAGVVRSHRGPAGGYELYRPAAEITVADVVRAVEGPLATVQDVRPELVLCDGAATNLQAVWVALRAAVRSVLEQVTLAQVVAGDLPPAVHELSAPGDAWIAHWHPA